MVARVVEALKLYTIKQSCYCIMKVVSLYGIVGKCIMIFLAICHPRFAISDDSSLKFSKNLNNWVEISERMTRHIEADPLFAKPCYWRVLRQGNDIIATPYVVELSGKWPSITYENSKKSIKVSPSAIMNVSDGWLIAYKHEVAFNEDKINDVYWLSDDGLTKSLVVKAWVNDFCLGPRKGEIFSGCREGILKFLKSEEGGAWTSELVVRFDFGQVFGISSDWKGGLLVFAETGWWEVSEDFNVKLLYKADQLTLVGKSISIKGDLVFVGGPYFVREVNLLSRKTRALCPSEEFYSALSTWTVKKFYNALLGNRE